MIAITNHEHLFAPLQLAGTTLRNRIVQAPMSVCYADPDGGVSDRMVEHYARRARGGVGMVIVENLAVSIAGRQLPRHALIDGADRLDGLARLAGAIKAEGAVAVVQVVHAGRYAGPWEEYAARRRLAPSAIPFPLPLGEVTPDEATGDELREVVASFARSAELAARAGFDGIEIHAAQGFLLSSFLSARMNARTDGYGGSFEHRVRLLLEVIAAMRRAAPDLLLGVHLMSDELMEGGWSIGDAVEVVPLVEQAGADFIVPVATTFESLRAPANAGLTARPNFQRDDSRAVKRAASVPVFANGHVWDPQTIEQMLAAGECDAVALARPLLSDPDWPRKVRAGREDAIRTCSCDPPLCLQTQMTGTICSAWPSELQAKGFIGLADAPDDGSAP